MLVMLRVFPLVLAVVASSGRGQRDLLGEGLAWFAPASAAVEDVTCRRHGARYKQGIRARNKWALNMLDASSKLPAGMLRGNLIDLGNYDQCLDVSSQPGEADNINGQLCLVSLGAADGVFSVLEARRKIHAYVNIRGGLAEGVEAKSDDIEGLLAEFGAMMALCIPSSCGPRDLERHLRSEMRGRLGNVSIRVDDMACSSKVDVTPYTRLDWFAM